MEVGGDRVTHLEAHAAKLGFVPDDDQLAALMDDPGSLGTAELESLLTAVVVAESHVSSSRRQLQRAIDAYRARASGLSDDEQARLSELQEYERVVSRTRHLLHWQLAQVRAEHAERQLAKTPDPLAATELRVAPASEPGRVKGPPPMAQSGS